MHRFAAFLENAVLFIQWLEQILHAIVKRLLIAKREHAAMSQALREFGENLFLQCLVKIN